MQGALAAAQADGSAAHGDVATLAAALDTAEKARASLEADLALHVERHAAGMQACGRILHRPHVAGCDPTVLHSLLPECRPCTDMKLLVEAHPLDFQCMARAESNACCEEGTESTYDNPQQAAVASHGSSESVGNRCETSGTHSISQGFVATINHGAWHLALSCTSLSAGPGRADAAVEHGPIGVGGRQRAGGGAGAAAEGQRAGGAGVDQGARHDGGRPEGGPGPPRPRGADISFPSIGVCAALVLLASLEMFPGANTMQDVGTSPGAERPASGSLGISLNSNIQVASLQV